MNTSIGKEFVLQHLPKRPRTAHKGMFGTLGILAGCAQYRGAAVLAAGGALRSGAGIVRVASTEAVCAAVAAQLPCCTLRPLCENSSGGVAGNQLPHLLENLPTAMLAGCGLSATTDTFSLIEGLLTSAGCPLVLDADALNVLSGHLSTGQDSLLRTQGLSALDVTKTPVVLTPHIGEMARLAGTTSANILADPAAAALAFAGTHGCVVTLKSHATLVATPDGDVYSNQAAGGPGLAKGGSGDVLAGIIASLLAQGLPPAIAAATGVWLHANAADMAAATLGEAGMSPADLPHYLALLLRELAR